MAEIDETTAQSIETAIKELITQIAPDAGYAEKYGGDVILPDFRDAKSFVGGIFKYKEHVSLEFSQGASFDDPKGYLDGKGKNRRHLKLASVDEVQSKDAEGYLRQALSA